MGYNEWEGYFPIINFRNKERLLSLLDNNFYYSCVFSDNEVAKKIGKNRVSPYAKEDIRSLINALPESDLVFCIKLIRVNKHRLKLLFCKDSSFLQINTNPFPRNYTPYLNMFIKNPRKITLNKEFLDLNESLDLVEHYLGYN